MAKTPVKNEVAEVQSVAQAPTEFEVMLEAWCAERSRDSRRPELITAFYRSEQRKGTVKGLGSDLQKRFDDFINRPA